MSDIAMLDYMLEHELLNLYVDENYGGVYKGFYRSMESIEGGQTSYKGHTFVVTRHGRVDGSPHGGGSGAAVTVVRVVFDKDELTLAKLKERERELVKNLGYAESTLEHKRKSYVAADEEVCVLQGDLNVCQRSIRQLKKKLERPCTS